MERDFTRGMDLFDPILNGKKKIVVVWAGGIGSTTTYTLAKMGCSNIRVVDFDTVDAVNCSSQFFWLSQVGKPKVEALAENIKMLCDEEIEAVNDKYKKEYIQDADIIIMALDNMETREQIVDDVTDNQFIFDPRMVKKIAVVNCFQWFEFEKQDWKKKELWFEAPEEVACTSKAVAFNAVGFAWLIWTLVAKHLEGEELYYSYELDNFNVLINKFKE